MATNSRFVLILILILTILIAIPAAEALRIVSAVNGDWDVAGTWTGGVPNPIDDVYISHVVSVVGDYHVNISSLGVSGTLNMNFNETAKLNVTGNVTIENGGTIHLGDLNSEMSNITILSGGHLNSTSGILNITDRNFTNSGSFTHNAGRVVMGGGTGENQTIGGNNETTFFNLNITNAASNITQVQNTTVEGVLDIATGSSYKIDTTGIHNYLTFGNASGGHTKAIITGSLLFSTVSSGNPVTIRGANAMHQAIISPATYLIYASTRSNSIVINLKWISLVYSPIITTNDIGNYSLNITGNISDTGAHSLTGLQFNVTQPGTNITIKGDSRTFENFNGIHIYGSTNLPISFYHTDGLTIKPSIKYTTFTKVLNETVSNDETLAINAPSVWTTNLSIDNITVNSTSRLLYGSVMIVDTVDRFVIISNSTFAGDANAYITTSANHLTQQIVLSNARLICIRCNFTKVGFADSASGNSIVNINATNPATGLQTNNTFMWGLVESNLINDSTGIQLLSTSGTINTNLTLLQPNAWETINDVFNTTFIIRENLTFANVTLTNRTALNISAGNGTTIINLNANGTLNLNNNANLTVMKNTTIQDVGFLNSRGGSNPINFGSLSINSGGRINSTGTLSIIEGNWTNAGAYTANGGRVIFNSTNAQHINGTSVTSFFNLNITNQIGLHQEQNATITNMLSIAAGASYRVYPGMLVNQTENSSINGTLQIDNKARFAVSDKGHAVFTGLSTLTLNGKLEVIEGELFNATINSTKITLNGSNIFLSNVVTTPIDARDIENLQLANIGKYVNITNLTSTPIMDLNFTYSDNDVPNLAVNEVNLDIYKFNDSDSKWYSTKSSTININTTTNIVSVENYTFIGSVFAAMIRDFVAPAVTSGGTASTSAGETIDIPSITDQKTSTLVDVTQGTETVITNDETAIPITEITFKSDTDVQGVIITIETFNDVKPDFLGDIANVYDYMQVSIEDIENKLFGLEELAEIKFKVTKEWLELNGLDKKKIKLFIWEDEAWRELDTILLAEEESTIEYKALSDDIDAYFAIALASAATPVEKSKLPFISTIPPVETGNIVFSFIIIIVFILIAINFLKSKKKRGWFEALIMKNRR